MDTDCAESQISFYKVVSFLSLQRGKRFGNVAEVQSRQQCLPESVDSMK